MSIAAIVILILIVAVVIAGLIDLAHWGRGQQ